MHSLKQTHKRHDSYLGPDSVLVVCTACVLLQFGPNCTTWLVAAEVFPTDVRATFQGISAAMGKVRLGTHANGHTSSVTVA
jgi:hypothetical protein